MANGINSFYSKYTYHTVRFVYVYVGGVGGGRCTLPSWSLADHTTFTDGRKDKLELRPRSGLTFTTLGGEFLRRLACPAA